MFGISYSSIPVKDAGCPYLSRTDKNKNKNQVF